MPRIKGQYDRANKMYLIRLYCDCGGEIVKKHCKNCHEEVLSAKNYPYWNRSHNGIKTASL